MHPQEIDITGNKFNRLTAIKRHGSYAQSPTWLFECDCGRQKVIRKVKVTSGYTKSCGCLRVDIAVERLKKMPSNKTHNLSKMKAYNVWQQMIRRCNDPDHPAYRNYGGRGISVCERWLSVENFYQDMGEPSPGMSLERTNNDRGYEPLNCRWASWTEQRRNSRQNKLTKHQVDRIREFRSVGIGCCELARTFGVSPSSITAICNGTNWRIGIKPMQCGIEPVQRGMDL
jgi:hypothetical protein